MQVDFLLQLTQSVSYDGSKSENEYRAGEMSQRGRAWATKSENLS